MENTKEMNNLEVENRLQKELGIRVQIPYSKRQIGFTEYDYQKLKASIVDLAKKHLDC